MSEDDKWAFLPRQEPEKSKRAAISVGRLISTGPSHLEAAYRMAGHREGGPRTPEIENKVDEILGHKNYDDGFITSHGRYVDRTENARLAMKSGQLPRRKIGNISESFKYNEGKGEFE